MIDANTLDSGSGALEAYLALQMPEADQWLIEQGVLLSSRPHRAACIIVDQCLESIEGDTKDGFWVKAWFGTLLSCVIDWYVHIYGDAIRSSSKTTHTAVLLIRNSPTALEVPLSFFSPSDDDCIRYLTFAGDLLPEEEPLNWLVRPPKLSLLGREQLQVITAEAAESSVNIRWASSGVLTLHEEPPQAMQHASLVLQYLERAAQNILSNEGRALSTAVWDANFAAEQAIKCYLTQSLSTKVPMLHDVRKLAALAIAAPIPPKVEDALKAMPSGRDAVRYRYNELSMPSLSLAMQFYRATLVICRYFLNAHPRKFRFNNTRIKMRFPPMPVEKSHFNL